MKTIENCCVIKRGLWLGIGKPKKEDDKCQGYCTQESDEPCEKCKKCRYLKGEK